GLRDNKSPFFKELESELLQNDLTMETAEKAFLNYLEKLDQVTRLEICGMYLDEEVKRLHVFGRTFHTPHIYFYRQLDRTTSIWTPWERVPVDIQGDHLIPVVWNRRLYVFWPIFTEKAIQGAPPRKYWQIQLAWSEYRNGKWSPKEVSSEFMVSKDGAP